jgi:hypothetical protein
VELVDPEEPVAVLVNSSDVAEEVSTELDTEVDDEEVSVVLDTTEESLVVLDSMTEVLEEEADA